MDKATVAAKMRLPVLYKSGAAYTLSACDNNLLIRATPYAFQYQNGKSGIVSEKTIPLLPFAASVSFIR
ncbi:hypothetical protein [Neisseria dentiae]|uniref:Uncharacterized protein n=1 Tax=Neisseria dentiae TaxID=194197 RepID=A0A1X3DDW7_9NEIS|nr:hypothetical protein [Neisseria dentiae]OSI17667.1 hypothetical protein BWD09_05110 [Neisseria dentiae]QMT46088.1 hypothetical protein H3L92_04730 [Neisseria dentiae]STZ52146.1 Uncharacterised protein [Neisseria dentiae]